MNFGRCGSLLVGYSFSNIKLSSAEFDFPPALMKAVAFFPPLISTGESAAERKTKKKR